jgi:hypothetical protein
MLNRIVSLSAVIVAVAATAGCGTPIPKSSDLQAANKTPAGCVDSTGTRVPVDQAHCVGFGRTWTQGDLRSTGYSDVGQALSTLDPSVQYRGNP